MGCFPAQPSFVVGIDKKDCILENEVRNQYTIYRQIGIRGRIWRLPQSESPATRTVVAQMASSESLLTSLMRLLKTVINLLPTAPAAAKQLQWGTFLL